MSWYLWALLSVIVLAGSEFSQKISMTQKVNISAITNNFFVWLLQGSSGLILTVFFGNFNLTFSAVDWLRLLLVAIIYFLGGHFYYTSFKSNSPSISIILGSISIVISTLLGIIFFKESTVYTKFIGIFLILVSVIWVNFKKQKFDKYNLFALLGGVCYGFTFTLDKSFAVNIDPLFYVVLMCFSVGLISFILKAKHIYSDLVRMKISDFYPILSTSFFGTLFNAFTFMSYSKGGNVGVVDALNNSNIFLVILLEVSFLKDRSNLTKKLIASTVVILGVILLSLTPVG